MNPKRVKTSEIRPELNSKFEKSRDSFEKRICDDLSHVILQYLSLEDKLRLECVSQQFRRTLFTKHYSIDSKISAKIRKISLESIEKLVKKLPNLSEVYLFDEKNKFAVFNQMFVEIVTKNCNNLTKIALNTNNWKQLLNKDFIDKFGSTLVSLKSEEYTRKYLQVIPYLSQLSNIEELIVCRIPDLTDVHFKGLKRLEIQEIIDDDIQTIKVLIEDNINTLKHLIIDLFVVRDERTISTNVFTLIPELKNLINLKIESKLLFDKQFDTYLTQIVLNCNQLKRLCFYYIIDENNSFEDLLSSIKRFKPLKRLDISLYFNIPSNEEKTPEIYLTTLLKCETFQELTHLELNNRRSGVWAWFEDELPPFNANNVFNDIEKCLPKLQSLRIYERIFICNESTADILSRLSNIQTIYLELTKDSPKDEIESKLKEKCKRIKSISFNA